MTIHYFGVALPPTHRVLAPPAPTQLPLHGYGYHTIPSYRDLNFTNFVDEVANY